MPNLGSSTSPSWAGWDQPGAGYGFSAQYTTPAFDIIVTEIHAYFNTINGNGAVGWLCVWDAPSPHNLLISVRQGIINNGTQSAGGQQWWSQPVVPGYVLAANSGIFIGGYCNQNLVFSTYDTNPRSSVRSMGTGGPTGGTGWNATNQGPVGGYIVYSQLNYGSANMGNVDAGLIGTGAIPDISSGIVHMGMRSTGGLVIPGTTVLHPSSVQLGSAGGGLKPTVRVIVPQIRIWRV